ncbi:HET-domain-containing protein, partial [Trematosphaeria pertusa]
HRYKPLEESSQEIRLLSVSIPSETHPEKIVCTSRTVSLQDNPYYWALSYVWGGWENPHTIVLDRRTFQVTRNLGEALHQLCQHEESAGSLWIDAICINQEDNTEKSWQVAMMGRIYTQAYAVHAWLG